jgi:multidrug efflux pump subunit AcrA (membrane-fusion protein)
MSEQAKDGKAQSQPEISQVEPTRLSQEDYRRHVLAVGVELARNATSARTLEEAQFVLVNDTRALLPFDRCFLAVHFRGRSELVATNNQPGVEKKSDFVQHANKFATALKDLNRGLALLPEAPIPSDMPIEVTEAIRKYMDYSKCSCLIIIPLSVYDHPIGHLVFEFFGTPAAGEVETLAVMNMAPFFSSALAEKWVLAKNPLVRNSYFSAVSGISEERRKKARRTQALVFLGLLVCIVVGLSLPVTLTIGGRIEAVPEREYFAFVQVDGIVDKVSVQEGQLVKRDQLVASLEPKEIDYKIREARRLQESYRAEMDVLKNMAAENPAKLAESQLLAIKSLRAQNDIEFLNWQRQFVSIRSPVDGIVLTKRADSLIGKRFKAGEPFCKIAPRDELEADIFVRESDVSFVQENQSGEAFFNFEPDRSYPIKVKSIAPISETLEHVGSVYRVRAALLRKAPELKPGMLGIAHIDTKKASLWFVVSRRIKTRIGEILLSW